MKIPDRLMRLFGKGDNDCRGGRVVFLIECLLNQNARDLGAAERPAVTGELLELLVEGEVGMAQIPCPEIACLGFARRRTAGQSIRQALEAAEPTACCRREAAAIAERIQCYLDQGYEVLAVLGGNEQSPGCAVHPAAKGEGRLTERSGVFMQVLAMELERRGCRIPFRGMRDVDPQLLAGDLDWLRERMQRR